ncbi:hypothetical protein HanPSC8_Chr02g0059431 [Helianthus annuus]|nr:hypothetical protein HanPSC8_Chr02g0059431 [Helianthus annuus]
MRMMLLLGRVQGFLGSLRWTLGCYTLDVILMFWSCMIVFCFFGWFKLFET